MNTPQELAKKNMRKYYGTEINFMRDSDDPDYEIKLFCDGYAAKESEVSHTANWVSCSDRLPEPFVIVIVNGGVALYTGSRWHTVTCCNWPGRPIGWEVTHWMPLPELKNYELSK